MKPTPEQARQRELAWAVYVTEGYIANVAHLRAVNAYTLELGALAALDAAVAQAQATARRLRAAMHGELRRVA